MRSLAAVLHRGSWRRNITIAALIAVAVTCYKYAWVNIELPNYSLLGVPWNPDRPTFPTFPAEPLANACDGVESPAAGNDTKAADAAIPNIVHYVWLLRNPSVLSLDFRVFVSVYSSHLFLHPDRIYFHTDAAPEVWERAKASGDTWTKRVLNIPGVTPNFVETPRVTSKGVEIDNLPSKADFIRADALRTFGGAYFDTDVVPLRDLAPLRHAGFANVVGAAYAILPKYTGYVNNGVWLSQPHSSLAEIVYKAMDAFYNGKWAIGVDILTDLAYRLDAVPGEVLIMNPRAFAPVSWELADQKKLFQPHLGTPSAAASGGVLDDVAGKPKELRRNTCTDALAWLRERELAGRMESWEIDFSATYVLHAFDGDIGQIRGWDHQITLKYVLARQSNYARAVYPAVWHAVKTGIIPKEETL
ncbi:uncharacterized protein B0T15DRAFT_496650 [Chaetomium strumarium]|uniref:Uncharacterized protein n=1 Tax=Chaetomium strumarium TaxID=1170767 RepID=A0AAJ0LYA0_9PEZI|nr:hypothetical protein B0T15DRAFT_496650 [Chaetomium strumarium]